MKDSAPTIPVRTRVQLAGKHGADLFGAAALRTAAFFQHRRRHG